MAYTVTSIPANGQLELTTGPGVAITSFTQDDINNNRLVYVHDGSNTTSDSFDFTVNDGQGNTLAGQSFALTITAVDDNAPTQSNNTGSTLAEGGTDTLINSELLYTDSEQPATAVAYTVTSVPANGQLELTTGPGVAVTSFTQDDINNNRLRYVHDGSNTTGDSFDFTVNDGQGNTLTGQSFALTITAVDDNEPTQSNNTGSTIAEGGTDTLISTELLYTDSEQPATSVAYSVTSIPANGQLELTTGPGVAVTSFTQDDINNNRLRYVHDGSNTTGDSFDFTVNDGQGNTLTGQSFALTITAVDDNEPTQSNNTGSTIAEGGTDTLISTELLYTDSEQPATSVAYSVTSIPANGQLELTTGPGVAITSFTQDDINNNRLVYVHDGSNTTADSFDYTVNDGQGNTLGAQSFALTITAVNDDPVGLPTISGTVQEDQVLSAGTGGITDADGVGSFSYQWLRDGALIGGATASTYTLGDADVGAKISVRVDYTDGQGHAESLTSAQSGAVLSVNDAPVGLPTISGTVQEDQVLSAGTDGDSNINGKETNAGDQLTDVVSDGGEAAVVDTPAGEIPSEASADTNDITADAVSDAGLAVTTDDTVILRPMIEAALVSVVVDAPPNSHPDAFQGVDFKPFTPKTIDLQNLDIAPFEAVSLEPVQVKSLMDNVSFIDGLETMNRDLDEAAEESKSRYRLGMDTLVGVTMSLSAGFVSWVLKSGSLMAGLMSSMPLWKQFDPLPILGAAMIKKRKQLAKQKTAVDEEDSKVEGLFK